jgi:shikimate kinase
MSIILIGMKGCGKTTTGTVLAKKLHIPFLDADTEIERRHKQEKGEAISFRQIFKQYGESYFNALDTRTLRHIAKEYGKTNFVFACGGRTPLQKENEGLLAELGTIVFLNIEKGVLLKRILAQGIPAFFPYQDDPEKSLDELLTQRVPLYKKLADITLDIGEETPEEIASYIVGVFPGDRPPF